MKVLLATDSTGVLSHTGKYEYGWTDRLIQRHPEWNIDCQRTRYECPTAFTLYNLHPYLTPKPDHYYDVTILKCGYHERIAFYSPACYSLMFGELYTDKGLHIRRLDANNNEVFSYKDITNETMIFNLLHRKSKEVVFVGMHDLINFRKDDRYNYELLAAEMRRDWYPMFTNVIDIPLDYISGDGMHLQESGINYLISTIECNRKLWPVTEN